MEQLTGWPDGIIVCGVELRLLVVYEVTRTYIYKLVIII